MSDNSDQPPIPGQTPLKLPPKPQPVAAPKPSVSDDEQSFASSPVSPKPATSPVIAKLPAAPKFVSPMPKIEESDSDIPAFLPVVAGIAAVVTLAFTVLIYLKR